LVANAPWEDATMLRIARDLVLTEMDRHGPVAAWIVDDTGFPKKGRHSVGVAHQYCGILGKQANCQVAVTVTLVNEAVSVPAAYQLYLPAEWARDRARRRVARIPKTVTFRPKWQIALGQILGLRGENVPAAPVVADAGYGVALEFRDALTASGIPYLLGVREDTKIWPPGVTPRPPRRRRLRGRPPRHLEGPARQHPVRLSTLVEQLPRDAWSTVTWREGTRGSMSSRFVALRVRPAPSRQPRELPPVEWVLAEWPPGEPTPAKYYLSTLSESTPLVTLVRLAHLRWRIERDYQELKDEFGLDHFEGRGWRGFHHHGSLCIAAYAFLAAERARLSPPEPLSFLRAARLPKGFTPRGAPGAA
jgi:SRSO17 transposase